jgi:hypothetical protein
MDLNNLRKLSQKWHDDTVNLILQRCNPQEIAREIVSLLQRNTINAAERGEYEAWDSFPLWLDKEMSIYSPCLTPPLKDFDYRNLRKVAKILFTMVQEQVNDKDIQLELIIQDRPDQKFLNLPRLSRIDIKASVKW